GAARAAVEALTRELAEGWRARRIAVVAAAIGRFDTESLRKYPESVWRGAARSVPLQRLGEKREFGWLVALLASPLGRVFSGSVVTLDGAADTVRSRAAHRDGGRGRHRPHRGAPAR